MGENTTMTPADFIAMNGGGGGMGQNWIWVILFVLIFGGFGMNHNTRTATAEDVANGNNFSALERQNTEIVDAVRQGVYDTTGAIKDASYMNLGEMRNIETALADGFAKQQTCCCETLRAIDGVNYNGAINTASINANTTAQTQKILDVLAQNKIDELNNKIQSLELQNAMCGVVRYPNAWTYNAGASPFCGGNVCGCNM